MTNTVDPSSLGFDADRLARLDTHLQKYVDDGRLPGWQLQVSRSGQIVHHSVYGRRDLERDLPWENDTIVRLFSMTKPVTSVAAMMLAEEGLLQLKDPVSKYIPEFGDSRVYRQGSFVKPMTEPLIEEMKVWHLFTHTSGLTYGFHNTHAVDAIYRDAGFLFAHPPGIDLAEACRLWAGFPLVFQPGTEWNYGVSTDVLGRVVEVVSGMPLDEFFRNRIFEPLGMIDTEFWVEEAKTDRLAQLYMPNPESGRAMAVPPGVIGSPTEKPEVLQGGGGLAGTAADYMRFCRMLLNRGELYGVRLLGSRTVESMAQNHLPGDADLEEFGRPLFSETTFDGTGFGLGFATVMDPVANKLPRSPGEFFWGGLASTAFWIDPVEDICVVFLTQLMPSSTYAVREELRPLVHQALSLIHISEPTRQ